MERKFIKLNITKRLFLFGICAVFTILSVACSNQKETGKIDSPSKFTIVTSFYPMYIFTKNITNDVPNVEVINMTEAQTGCLHDYQLSSADMKTLESAKVFVINGAGMESFMDKVTSQMKNLKVVEAAKGIELLESNPHIWVGISGAIKEAKSIAEQLETIDKQNADKYKNNCSEYVDKLNVLRTKMNNALKDVKNRDIITFHEAFTYFAKEFNLNVAGVIEKEPGQEPTAEEIADIMKTVKDKKVKALFTEVQYSPKAAQTIANETGAKVYQFDLAVTGAKNADADSYIKSMEKNLDVLTEALK
jgi:zinc transport system substrate-binding protein